MGFGRDASYATKVAGAYIPKEVIAKRSDLVRIDGGRIKSPAANGDGSVAYQTLYAGQLLGYASTGADAGLWKPYAPANTDGSQNAAGVLDQTLTIDSLGTNGQIGVIKGATLYKDLLIGYDAAAKASLKASESVEHGVNLVTIFA